MNQTNGLVNPANSRIALDTSIGLIEDAFDGDPAQSLLASLRDVQEEDWTALPSGGERSIANILEHIGWSKWMYDDYAFGSASMQGDQPPLIPADGSRLRPRDELLGWPAQGHHRWIDSVRALTDDSELHHAAHKLGRALAHLCHHPHHDRA